MGWAGRYAERRWQETAYHCQVGRGRGGRGYAVRAVCEQAVAGMGKVRCSAGRGGREGVMWQAWQRVCRGMQVKEGSRQVGQAGRGRQDRHMQVCEGGTGRCGAGSENVPPICSSPPPPTSHHHHHHSTTTTDFTDRTQKGRKAGQVWAGEVGRADKRVLPSRQAGKRQARQGRQEVSACARACACVSMPVWRAQVTRQE